MATQTIEAVFQGGVFRPLAESPRISEGQHVRLVVEVEDKQNLLELAGQVFDGLSEEDVHDVEKVALDRRDFFESPAK